MTWATFMLVSKISAVLLSKRPVRAGKFRGQVITCYDD